MKIKIKKILIENFKGCKNAQYDFGDKTKIMGANASGKTTIMDAFTWLLFNKDSLGSEKFSIRPLDTDGKMIDNVEIKVSAVLEVDGKDVELTKVQKQKWVTPRGSSVSELKGNENLFEVDGYPKTEKDYKQYISGIIDEDLFKMLTNPTYFTSLKWKEQRDILIRFVSGTSDYELAQGKPEFAALLDELQKAPNTDAIQEKYSKALKEWKNKLIELPVRIDEAQKQKIDIDVAELEVGKKAIAELLKSNAEKQNDISKQYVEKDKLANEIMELKFSEGDIQRKANENIIKQRRELEDKISNKQFLIKQTKDTISSTENLIGQTKRNVSAYAEKLEKSRTSWMEANERTFNEDTLICSYCGQEYPEERKEKLRAEFEQHKADELRRITFEGSKAKDDLKKEKECLEKLEKELPEHNKSLEMLTASVVELEKQLSELPASIDVTDTDEYKELQSKIVELEKKLESFGSADDIKKTLHDEENDLRNKLAEIDKQIAKADMNIQLDSRIEELQAEQRMVAQKVADQEKMISVLEEYIRYKMNAISAAVNSKFDDICFKLFENQINGGLKETCECTVHGVPYSSLNNGHRIVAGLQIIKALQQLYDVSAPIFVDNAESVNEGNLPNMDCQMNCMYVASNMDLKVEAVE